MITNSGDYKTDLQSTFMANVEKSKNLDIACCVVGESGHLIPICRLAQALEKRGHKVTIITMSYAIETA